MQVKSIDTYFDPSLWSKTYIHCQIGTTHVHRARAHKALATIFCRIALYNFEVLFLLLLLLLLLLSFLHVYIWAPKNLKFSVKFANPWYINFEREEASEYLRHVLFVACSRRKC